MAITLVQSTPHPEQAGAIFWNDNDSGSFNAPAQFAPGSTAILVVSIFDENKVVSGTVDGVTLIEPANARCINASVASIILYAPNLPGTSDDIILTTDNNSYLHAVLLEFSGLKTSGVIDQAPTPVNEPQSVISTGPLSQANELVVTVAASGADEDISQGFGWVEPVGWELIMNWAQWGGSSGGGAAYKIVNSTDAVTATWRFNRQNGGMVSPPDGGAAIVTFEGAATAQPIPFSKPLKLGFSF